MTLPVIGIDPGKKGYVCRLDFSSSPPAVFWSAPVKDAEKDEKPQYDLPAMVQLCARWREHDNVRLVVIEAQAPRAHGRGKFAKKEGTWSAWSNGYGFGSWETALTAAGFAKAENEDALKPNGRDHKAVTGTSYGASCPFYLVVDPLVWKRRMGAFVTTHKGEDSIYARKKANDQKTIEVAQQIDPTTDFRATERTEGARVLSADKCAARLLAEYGLRWVLGVRRVGT